MKTFLVLCAAAALTGCAVYPAPYETHSGGPVPYPVEQPVYIEGGGVYRSGGFGQPYPYPRAYHRPPPPIVVVPQHRPPPVVVVPQHRPVRPFVLAPQYPGRGNGDRDRDGIPNRVDRDRDGDGIPNRFDRDRNNDGIPDRAGRDRDRDRDGDGIPNRRDPQPMVPNRR